MKIATKSYKDSSSAVVVDGKLILSLPDAVLPVVWQMDLDQTKSSALEVQESGGNFPLVLKTTENKSVEVAKFDNRAGAVQALMAASRALEKAHGQIRSAHSAGVAYAAPSSPRRPWLAFVLGLLMLFVLLNVWGYINSKNLVPNAATSSANGESQNQQAPNTRDGEPMSADEFLKRN